MVRIICPECKDSYLEIKEDSLTCPSCKATFSKDDENLILGIQYYNECDYDKANDSLMKYIVKAGADAKAIFYKALCDGFCYDEDTLTIAETYEKLFESLKELSDEDFPKYLAVANDECEKLEKAVAQSHIHLFVDADAEKIKKEVSTIINLQNEAKAFRIRLNALVNEYNDKATAKLSVKFSDCFLVEPELATQVGDLKFEKITENVASHTVFTGILSTDIKNLEIYYRCIVMFFKKNRQKYDFLMASAEKFSQLSKLLEDGQYNTIKGTAAIGDKLKSAGYDFFQESLKDNDEEFETQTETVVILEEEAPEETQEEVMEFEDISSSSENTEEITDEADTQETTTDEQAEEAIQTPVENTEIEVSEDTTIADEDTVIEIPDDTSDSAENTESEAENESVTEQTEEEADVTEEETVSDGSDVIEEEAVIEIIATEETVTIDDVQEDTEIADVISKDNVIEEPEVKQKKRKKSYSPFITAFLIIAGIVAIICFTVVPEKLNQKNYTSAAELVAEQKYAEAVAIYAELGDYEDSAEKLKATKYAYASKLESEEKYDEAKKLYSELESYEDSMAKVSSCTYNMAVLSLTAGNFDEAKSLFETIPDYADSKDKVLECTYQKAISFVSEKKYDEAIKIFESIADYSESKTKILEAKYKYVNENLSRDNKTTLAYLEDLIEARYQDSVAIRRKLLGNSIASDGVSACLNYSQTDITENITEADKSKQIYYHVSVADPELYGKKLTVAFTTSVGYTERKTFTPAENNTTFTVTYPSTNLKEYTVDFYVTSADGTELAKQTVTIK